MNFFLILQVWFYYQNEQNEGVSRWKIQILFLVNHPNGAAYHHTHCGVYRIYSVWQCEPRNGEYDVTQLHAHIWKGLLESISVVLLNTQIILYIFDLHWLWYKFLNLVLFCLLKLISKTVDFSFIMEKVLSTFSMVLYVRMCGSI